MKTMFRLASLCVSVLLLVACAGITSRHGHIPTDEELAAIEVGVSTPQQVFDAIGTPTLIDDEYGVSWIFVENTIHSRGLRAPEVVERNVVLIAYGNDGTVSNVETYGLEDGIPVRLTQRVTETHKGRLTLVQQILRSLGRVTPDLIAPDAANRRDEF